MRKLLSNIIKTTLVSMVFMPYVAYSQDNLGASYLGICSPKWPCKPSLQALESMPVRRLGWLVGTFGNACPCAQEFLQSPGPKYIRVHLANCTCFPARGRRCGAEEPFRGESIQSAEKKLLRRDAGILKRYRRNLSIAKKTLSVVNPLDTQVRLSMCLESTFGHDARKVMLEEARKVFPTGVFVDNVLAGACIKGLICEKHGVNPSLQAPCISDTDGDDYRVVFPVAKPQCVQFLWQGEFNLLDLSNPNFVDPRKRTNAPSQHDFDYLKDSLANPGR